MKTTLLITYLAIIFALNALFISSFLHVLAPTGQASGTVTLEIVPSAACRITLNETWNFISICKNTTQTNISEIINGSSVRFILEWNEQNQSYKVFSVQSQNNPFTHFNLSKSYFIWLENDTFIYTPSGDNYDNLSVKLDAGWNTPFYPYEKQGNTTVYLSTLNPDWRFMLKWNQSSQNFVVRSALSSTPTFTSINKGEGQFIYLAQDATLNYVRDEVIT